jgi:TIR domain
VPVRKVFISYARQNKGDIEQLVEHLRVLGCDTWHDSSLHGGQDWWCWRSSKMTSVAH